MTNEIHDDCEGQPGLGSGTCESARFFSWKTSVLAKRSITRELGKELEKKEAGVAPGILRQLQ
jgi:hypothetical protein